MSTHARLQPSAVGIPEFLESRAWYRALPAGTQRLVRETAVARTVAAGEFIARSGEPCLHWYGVMRGFLQMYVLGSDGAETTLYCVREGEWCGDGSLLKKELRRYDLRALTPSLVLMVPAETFETLHRSSIEFNQFLCRIMNERMGGFVEMLVASRLFRPEMRVARGLLMLASGQAEDEQELSIPQHELGLICGLSRQRVNMALGRFKRIGLVRGEIGKGTVLVDVARLRAYVMDPG
jgi:CRP-like cAMP-binding protein